MSSAERLSNPGVAVSMVYRLLRALARFGFAVFYPRIRLLHAESALAAPSIMLLVSNPPNFLCALVLVAALERPVRCLVPEQLLQGLLRKLIGKGLGMIPYNPKAEGWRPALEQCCDFWARRQAIAVFAGKAGQAAQLLRVTATMALETEARPSGKLGLTLFPVHLFVPIAPPSELLVYVDGAIYPQEHLEPKGGASSGAVGALAARLERACQENAFRLQPECVRQFLSNLEEILITDMEEDWSSRSRWKQNSEGFRISQFVADWAEQINYLDPGKLVALRGAVNEYREGQRRWSLRELEIGAGGKWVSSFWGKICIWLETAVGLPIAAYGLMNHLLLWLLLLWFGLLKKGSERSPKTQWLLRTLVVLGCYSVQILLCASWQGRAAAGFYAPSLPLAGAYLWRYGWLLRHRTWRVLAAVLNPVQARKLRRRRRELLAELNTALESYAVMLGVVR